MQENDQLGESLVYDGLVPISWQLLTGELAPARQLEISESNEDVLRFIAALEEYRAEVHDEAQEGNAPDLSRVEMKTDLILEMVAQILAQQMKAPSPVQIWLSATGISWMAPSSVPEVGQKLSVDVYIDQRYPRPLTFQGKVTLVSEQAGEKRVMMGFENLSHAVRGGLEKLIFRQHRRIIALNKHQSGTSTI
ncbi:MAG: PilZ domain-containing protein [Gammaproteobacteria bacterium]